MSTSTRFAVATHLLTVLAIKKGAPARSEDMAERANTNPAVIRKILSMTNKAGLTSSQLGHGGGSLLARKPAEVTLLDIYDAVEEPELFSSARCDPDKDCPVGSQIQQVLGLRTAKVEAAMRRELAKTTLAQLVREITAKG